MICHEHTDTSCYYFERRLWANYSSPRLDTILCDSPYVPSKCKCMQPTLNRQRGRKDISTVYAVGDEHLAYGTTMEVPPCLAGTLVGTKATSNRHLSVTF
ncbi:hypothetical protein PPTG_23316 [Phytophthora nicotianae INRA-310]|uniref:Uncharacterized protein n=3 Tax=Phytophthora nicotianae TaxID=4792 RepID=W2Q2P4_PHYN3|nr:hypothetical protein PPTG_23316 [Phytophthora nicotianae INRA-310]ETM43075.1 hypothetical protein L914_11375 [Phytophthora nicotianae]ETN06560.1 hypothetical protein PPTG_23316 [Phytophthora nicotianae INRA-310]ETO71821.1 hypothetical protein F444_11923 [Phytophthora nicotianae P1976]